MTVRVDGSSIDPECTAQSTAASAIPNTVGSIVPRWTTPQASLLNRADRVGVLAVSGTDTIPHTPRTAAQTTSGRARRKDRGNNEGLPSLTTELADVSPAVRTVQPRWDDGSGARRDHLCCPGGCIFPSLRL